MYHDNIKRISKHWGEIMSFTNLCKGFIGDQTPLGELAH